MIINNDCYIKISLYLDDDHNINYFRISKTILDILPEEKNTVHVLALYDNNYDIFNFINKSIGEKIDLKYLRKHESKYEYKLLTHIPIMKFIKILHKQSNVIQIIKYSKLLEEIMIRDIIINNDKDNDNDNNLLSTFLLTLHHQNIIPKYLEWKKSYGGKRSDNKKILEVNENSLCNKTDNLYEVNECADEQNQLHLEPDDIRLSDDFVNNCLDQINIPQFNSVAKDFALIDELTNERIEMPHYDDVKEYGLCDANGNVDVDAFSNINMFNSHKRSGNGTL